MGCRIRCYREIRDDSDGDFVCSTKWSKEAVKQRLNRMNSLHQKHLTVGDTLINIAKFEVIILESIG